MTYLEAAEKVLREAGVPLHYREISKRAVARQLIELRGKTPEATMGAQLYMAVKRAEEQGEPAQYSLAGRGTFALATPVSIGTLDEDIRRQNSRVETELLEYLYDMHPRQVELLVGQLLTAIGFEAVNVTRYSGDGGIDVDAVLTVGGVTRVRTAIQVKRWRQNVPGATVREIRGGLMTDQRGLIITTAGFTKDAIAEADSIGKTPISLIDGKRFIELLVEKQIGVRRRAISLLQLNVGELLAEDVEEGGGERSAGIWPLPGGQANFFETLLAFLDRAADGRPTVNEFTAWVIEHYEKVTKQSVVLSYLRAVLYSMGLIDFDGERITLTPEGDSLRNARDGSTLLRLLKKNILGVAELLDNLESGPADTASLHASLIKKLSLAWETDIQTKYRIQWLVSCGAIERNAEGLWMRRST